MEEQFTAFQRAHRLWSPGDRLALAVSGGIDSMVMLHLFLNAGIPFAVLHLNFKLRGPDSDEDEAFVKNACARHQLEFRVQHVDLKSYATRMQLSVQEAARQVRYAWFEQELQKDFNKIATAHHQNDAAETFFLNLTRGTGITGLAGIPIERQGVIRPLLFASRAAIDRYAAEHQITWREDATNEGEAYTRNRIRHALLPRMNSFNPSWLEAFGSTQARLRAAAHFLQVGIGEWKSTWQKNQNDEWLIPSASIIAFGEPAATLWEAVKEFGFSFAVCKQLVHALQNPQPGKYFESATHRLSIDRNTVMLAALRQPPVSRLVINAPDGTYEGPFGRMTLQTGVGDFTPPAATACLDLDLIHFPIIWRPWRPGDRFLPLGMTGYKKVSDFLIDQKIPRHEKQFISVLESRHEIIWVVGHRIHDHYKITEKTRRPILFQWARQRSKNEA